MHFPNTLLIGLAAAVAWGASRFVAPAPFATADDVPALGIPGSAYGSLAARTMRSSLYAYWHGGEAYRKSSPPADPQAAVSTTPPSSAPPPPTPGVFSRRRLGATPEPASAAPTTSSAPAHAPGVTVAAAPSGPLLDRMAAWLNALETRRTQRHGNLARTAAHQRFINASTGWRLRLATNLDPGDPILYEILHQHILVTSQDTTKALGSVRVLSHRALTHALSNQAGMMDSLTGLGAAINVLNDMILSARPALPAKTEVVELWYNISQCQQRYHDIRTAAESEGWWQNIPEIRRFEIDNHARFLDELTKKMHEFLKSKELLANYQ